MTTVKICGVRRPADATLAAELGARYVGCVVAADSPRCARGSEVADIALAVGAESLVLVTRRSGIESTRALAHQVGVRRLQIHGATPDEERDLREEGFVCHTVAPVPPHASTLPPVASSTIDSPGVLDHGSGGRGTPFDWRLLTAGCPPFTLIAGGVSPTNVPHLLTYRPFGIDVSSGVEARPGIKDPGLLRSLFAALERPQ